MPKHAPGTAVPECRVCYQPIWEASTDRIRYHVACHKVYRKHYNKARYDFVSAMQRHPTPEDSDSFQEQALQLASDEIAEAL